MSSADENTWIQWHRLFGIALTHFFANSPYKVELEKDLSIKQQFLDVVIVRYQQGEFSGTLPDGLENLTDYNLLSYKSLREPLDDWTLKELTGHYVNYRKQISGNELEEECLFHLYGVSTRFPQKLAEQVQLTQVQPGVYEVTRGTDVFRIIVLREMPRTENNAFWHLFSAVDDQVRYGAANLKLPTNDASTVLKRLLGQYQLEGLNMPYTVEQFNQEVKESVMKELTIEDLQELLSGLPAEKRQELLNALSAEERQQLLNALSAEERQQLLNALSPEERQQLFSQVSVQERLQGLSIEEIRTYLDEQEKSS